MLVETMILIQRWGWRDSNSRPRGEVKTQVWYSSPSPFSGERYKSEGGREGFAGPNPASAFVGKPPTRHDVGLR
jgi:hypothetical protein